MDENKEVQLPDPGAELQTAISVNDLISMCNKAARQINTKKSNRLLLLNCGYAIRQLAQRLDAYENPPKVS